MFDWEWGVVSVAILILLSYKSALNWLIIIIIIVVVVVIIIIILFVSLEKKY